MMPGMKKLCIALSAFVFLAACGGGSDTTASCEFAYWDGIVGTCLPGGWHVVDRQGLDQRGVPRDVIVAFQADVAVAGQFPTVTVTREALAKPVEASAYSDASIQSVKSLPGYQELDLRDTTINEMPLKLHIFSAQPRPDEPKTRFYQVSMAKDKAGFTYTAATPLSVDSATENQILLILQNASLEKPVETTEE